VNAQNLHCIMGRRFKHSKPNLCPTCQFCQPYEEWEGFCTVYQKILSAPNSEKGRCKDYRQDKLRAVTDAENEG